MCMCECVWEQRITSSVCDVMPFFSVSADDGHTSVAASSFNFLGTKNNNNPDDEWETSLFFSQLFAIIIAIEIKLLAVKKDKLRHIIEDII